MIVDVLAGGLLGLGVLVAGGDYWWQRRRGRRDAELEHDVALSPDEARALEARAPMFGGSQQHAGLLPPMVLEIRGPLPAVTSLAFDDRAVDVGPPPGLEDRRRRDVGRPGRHRRDEAGPDAVTMTGFMRQLDARTVELHRRSLEAIAAETGTLPRIEP